MLTPKDLVFAVLWLAASASAEVSRQPTALWAWLSGSADEALAQLDAHREIVTHVSLGGYSVGADLRLTGSPNRTLLTVLKSYDITVHPLIGGGDIATLRALFSNATATRLFAAEAAAEASRLGLGGFNIDFEPYKQGSTYADAVLFAEFTDTLAKELHNSGNAKLSIDFFSNLAFWDIGALNATTDVDYLISMDT